MNILEKDVDSFKEESIVNGDEIFRFQEKFCKANNLYMTCLGSENGVITKMSGKREEICFFQRHYNEDDVMRLLKRAKNAGIEHIIEAEGDRDNVKLSCVTTEVGKSRITWLVFAAVDFDDTEYVCPVRTTTKEHYYRCLELLEYLSMVLFDVKMTELVAEEKVKEYEFARKFAVGQLKKSEAMATILRKLESEEKFGKIIDEILKTTCNCLGISRGFLLGTRDEVDGYNLIAEYSADVGKYHLSESDFLKSENVPFFDGKPYLISSDSFYPDRFKAYMNKEGVLAAIYQPIENKKHNVMYIAFEVIDKEKVWDSMDVKFINDVKRIIQGILQKKIAINSIKASFNVLREVLDTIDNAICVTNPTTKEFLYSNSACDDFLEMSLGKDRISESFFNVQEIMEMDYDRDLFCNRGSKWYNVRKSSIKWVDGSKACLYRIVDVTEQKLYEKKVDRQIYNDYLTGLYNRRKFEHDLEKAIRRAMTDSTQGAVLYVDVDDFKTINKKLGHYEGDLLLKSFGEHLEQVDSIANNCYRIGGDELAVIVNLKKHKVKEVCEGISKAVAMVNAEITTDIAFSVSVGIASFPKDGNTVDEIVAKADTALLEAKSLGRGQIKVYSKEQLKKLSHKSDIEMKLKKAVGEIRNEFEVYYQPVIDKDGKEDDCCGAEALVRWNSPDYGMLSPKDFITEAENCGLIHKIGQFVLFTATSQCKKWNDCGHPDYAVNVNLSVSQLLNDEIVDTIKAALRESRLNPKNLVIEVTDALSYTDMERMRNLLGRIKSLGVRIALDDFGVGFASFNNLRDLPIDILKIDRSLVGKIGEDDFSKNFVDMAAMMAKSLGFSVCAQGIENDVQRELLKDMPIQYMQGYRFEKPINKSAFEIKYL